MVMERILECTRVVMIHLISDSGDLLDTSPSLIPVAIGGGFPMKSRSKNQVKPGLM
jgi:hypothetical protein